MLSERQEGVRAWHQEAEAEAQRRREEAMRQRLAALKSSDMGAYLAMVRNTKNRWASSRMQHPACLVSTSCTAMRVSFMWLLQTH